MDSQLKEITLANIDGGAAPELFQIELERVLANILDPNTDPEKKRKITITVEFRPHESREMARTDVQVKSKLAPHKPVAGQVFLGKKGTGELVATQYDPRQGSLFGEDQEEDPDIRPINEGESA